MKNGKIWQSEGGQGGGREFGRIRSGGGQELGGDGAGCGSQLRVRGGRRIRDIKIYDFRTKEY